MAYTRAGCRWSASPISPPRRRRSSSACFRARARSRSGPTQTSRSWTPGSAGRSARATSRHAAASAPISAANSPAGLCGRFCGEKRSTLMATWWASPAGENSCGLTATYQELWICRMGIDRTLLEQRLNELYAIGAEPDGGAYRPLYGAAWATAVERVERWLKDAGLKTRRDAVGNLWGRAEGDGKSIVTGSHIDTVRHGGRLDGALGIVAGLTAVESLRKEKGKPRRTIEVVAICEEEGSPFNTTFWGSRAIIGDITDVDEELAEAMRERGLDPARIPSAARNDVDSYLELHIEQGAVLESAGMQLAVVSAIVGTAHLEVTVTGRPDHAGTTPMTLRRDAMAAAAVMIQSIESAASSAGSPAVATVGRIRA